MKKNIFSLCVMLIAALYAGSENTTQSSNYTYKKTETISLKMNVFLPENSADKNPKPAILLFHGGGWRWGRAEWVFETAEEFSRLGVVAIAVDYRLSVGKTTPLDALEDTLDAFRWTRAHKKEFNIDANRIAGYGVSAGGHLVAAAATVKKNIKTLNTDNGRPNLLLLWSPALDVVNDNWFKKLIQGKGNSEEFSPSALADEKTPPTCIITGEKDTLTPLSGIKKYQEKVLSHKGICELHVYPGVGHLLTRNLKNQENDFDPDPEFRKNGKQKLVDFLKKQGYLN